MINVTVETHFGEALTCPKVHCDVCGEPIEDYEYGLYRYPLNDDFIVGKPVSTVTLHKGTCDRKFEAVRPLGDTGWDELRLLPIYIAHNMGMTFEEE